MADEQTTSPEGVERTAEGTIVDQSPKPDQSPPTTTQETKTESTPESESGKTLLTEGKKEEPAKPAEKGAPDAYSDYTVPDGYTLDPQVKADADKIFKNLGLSQEAAQSLVDFYTQQTTEAFRAPFEAYQKMTDSWRQESESHPDLRGKLGPGKEISVRIAKAIDGIGDAKLASDFREAMDISGIGNHPAFIRVLSKFAERLTEGSHVAGNGPAKAGQSEPNRPPPSAAAAMWPNLPSSRG
jgi:hypothetical protein